MPVAPAERKRDETFRRDQALGLKPCLREVDASPPAGTGGIPVGPAADQPQSGPEQRVPLGCGRRLQCVTDDRARPAPTQIAQQ